MAIVGIVAKISSAKLLSSQNLLTTMIIYPQTYLIASTPLPNPKTLETQPPSENPVSRDPLIAAGWQNVTYAGSVMVMLGVLAIIGIFSQKIEYVIGIAFVLSMVLIACFLVIGL